MIDISELIDDPDFATSFERVRAGGALSMGRLVAGTPVVMNLTGVIQPASAEDRAEFLPEGERSNDMVRIWTRGDLRKSDGKAVTADLINWQGNQYRVIATKTWQQHGYVKAWAVGIGSA